jgi:hypothetical protein
MTLLFDIFYVILALFFGAMLMFFAGLAAHEIPKFIIKKTTQKITERKIKKNPAFIGLVVKDFSETLSEENDVWRGEKELRHPKRIIQKCILAVLSWKKTQESDELLLPLLVKTLWYQELPVGWFYWQDVSSTEARKRKIEQLFIEDFGYCYNHAPDKLKPRLFWLASEKFGAIMDKAQKAD